MEKDVLTLYEVVGWMAQLAAIDGVIAPSERKVLARFARQYGFDVGKIIRLAYALSDQATPEVELADPNVLKGRRFEEFVVSLIADRQRYCLLSWRGDKVSNHTFALDSLYPDLHIRHKMEDGETKEYFVECKFRSSWGDEGIDLSGQFNRYHFHAKDQGKELFIALGVGGKPQRPEELYLIPGRMVGWDKRLTRERFVKCICGQTAEEFHRYITHYFEKRVR